MSRLARIMAGAIGIAVGFGFAHQVENKTKPRHKTEPCCISVRLQGDEEVYKTPFNRKTHPEDMRPVSDQIGAWDSIKSRVGLTGTASIDRLLVATAVTLHCTMVDMTLVEAGATLHESGGATLRVIARNMRKYYSTSAHWQIPNQHEHFDPIELSASVAPQIRTILGDDQSRQSRNSQSTASEVMHAIGRIADIPEPPHAPETEPEHEPDACSYIPSTWAEQAKRVLAKVMDNSFLASLVNIRP